MQQLNIKWERNADQKVTPNRTNAGSKADMACKEFKPETKPREFKPRTKARPTIKERGANSSTQLAWTPCHVLPILMKVRAV